MASNFFAKSLKRSALTVALGLCFAGTVQAQSTVGSIRGSAPANSTITVSNNSGFSRTVTVGADGRYSLTNLPIGDYTVTSGSDRRDIVVTVGATASVSFGSGGATELGAITVRGISVPTIDIAATDTRTVITAAELDRMPIPRSAEAIAMLSPGAVTGNGAFFGGEVSFGGSSVAENAYYLNGYFSGNPMTNIGGTTLPYGSIEQQETYTGGYGARFGRSSGGVISQVGKSGSNEWHFGGQIVWTPRSLRSVRPDRYMPDMSSMFPTPDYSYSDPTLIGAPYDRGTGRKSWDTTYSAYIGGPIVQDRLFFFLSAEYTDGNSVTPGGNPDVGFAATGTRGSSENTSVYFKLNWNITDNHMLEATYTSSEFDGTAKTYAFDWNTYSFGNYLQPGTASQSNTEFSVIKYTGFLTDNLTLSATWGHSRNAYNTDPFLTGLPYIASSQNQNPALNGGTPIRNTQATYRATKNTRDYTDGLRVELEWVVGDHTLTVGMDNTKLAGQNEGTSQVADAWIYGKAGSSGTNASSALGVGPTGDALPGVCNGAPLHDLSGGRSSNCGYNVYRLRYFDTTSMHNRQNAWYLEDRWQITDNLLLSIGVRADSFENFSDTGVRFVDSGVQWQPRLGFAWDVNGDSTFKVFGNAGRYFLNMPNAVAIRGVGASTYTREYFTYTGINPDGSPILGAPLCHPGQAPNAACAAGPVSSNGEFGVPKDPLTYVPSDIKSQYQDEFVLGFEHTLTANWTLGAKLTRRVLKSAIDDMCDAYTLMDAAGLNILGYDYSRAGFIGQASDGKLYVGSACYMFNPGGSNTYAFQEVIPDINNPGRYVNVNGVYKQVKVSSSALGMPPLKRNYSALDLFLERPWDGKWSFRVDYTYSRSSGNSEGPANSDTGQGSNPHDNGVATSQNWDAWQIMAFADGYLPNDRRHQLKARGAYAINDEWLVSGSLRISSGAPIMCFGYYDPDGSINHGDPAADPIGYGNSYHTCFNQPWTPGRETTPWTKRFDFGVTYRPSYFDHKLALNLNIFNVFNSRVPTSFNQNSEDDGPYGMNNDYMLPVSYTTPRYVQLSVTYDY